jgi:glycine hydroxymethyltransferase
MYRQIGWLIDQERIRQQHELEMIASENYVSPAVMQSCGNVFTNKYSEGYPGRRYYGGQKRVDRLERTCQWRALKMFGLLSDDQPDSTTQDGYQQIKQQVKAADRAVNVQPLSGSPANLAVYLGVLSPGDTILGMDLAAG